MLHDLLATLPIWLTAVIGCLLLILDAAATPSQPASERRYLGYLSAGGAVACLATAWLMWGRTWGGFETPMFGQMMTLGPVGLATCAVILLITTVVSLMAVEHAEEQGFSHGELYSLIHFAAFGMMIMATATHLASLFVGLEIMSISVYVLAAVKRQSPLSAEAGLKYFLLGAFASGILLYGAAFIYGETASLEYGAIKAALEAKPEHTGYLGLGLALLGVAFGFKIALVPFHMWTPDVYQGAPPPVTALMATGVKAAAVIAMARLFSEALPSSVIGEALDKDFLSGMALFAVLTMIVGNTLALHQQSLKRLLGYSSIAHAGYLVIGVLAAHRGGEGLGPVLFYLFTYALANLAVFAVISMLVKGKKDDIELDDIAGLSRTHPFAALVLSLGMLSLAGVPPMAGFFGKLVLFRSALAAETDGSKFFLWLVVIAMLSSVISVYYYLRVIVAAYMREPKEGEAPPVAGRGVLAAFVIAAVGTVWVGIFPGRYIRMSEGVRTEDAFLPAERAADATPAPVALPRPGGPAAPAVPVLPAVTR